MKFLFFEKAKSLQKKLKGIEEKSLVRLVQKGIFKEAKDFRVYLKISEALREEFYFSVCLTRRETAKASEF